jgi:D-3-phosphoglycerate dehydrogenase
VIGCGNIGSIVADRALGLRMKVIAFDPFLSPERAKDIGVEKVDLDDCSSAPILSPCTPR